MIHCRQLRIYAQGLEESHEVFLTFDLILALFSSYLVDIKARSSVHLQKNLASKKDINYYREPVGLSLNLFSGVHYFGTLIVKLEI